ncbi:hypothetical protein B0H13DRAFT_2670540 [Mycena leptocephala]|nr:hypothetical protein B0H13DRAFT_2670540 [Mycena leptocephala]
MTLFLSTSPQEDPLARCMDPAASFNLNTTLGSLQIGVLISYVLFGVTTTQTYIYYSRFPHDSWKLKALVAFVWICEIAHAICVGHTLYVYTISAYAHPERLAGPTPVSLETSALLAGVIVVCVQGFFSFRIYAFSKKISLSILIWVMVFCVCWVHHHLRHCATDALAAALRGTVGWLLAAVWSVSTANDLLIAATLVVLLRNQRTDVHRSAYSITTLACFLTMKENFIWVAFLSPVHECFRTRSWLV